MKRGAVIFFILVATALAAAAVSPAALTIAFDAHPLERFSSELVDIRARNGFSAHDAAPTEGVALRFPRERLRAGERWAEGEIRIAENAVADSQLTLEVFALGERTPRETATAAVGRTRGMVAVDLRRLGLREARVVARLTRAGQSMAAAEARISAVAAAPLAAGTRIPIDLDAPWAGELAEPTPVTFGVPFPAGALWSERSVRVVDASGKAVPFQMEVSGRWAREGSIQWLRCDALLTPAGRYFVAVGEEDQPAIPVVLRVREIGDRLIVETGAATFVIGNGVSPIEEIQHDGGRVTSAGTRGLYVVDQHGTVASASADGASRVLESHGPFAASIRCEGYYRTAAGEPRARHITRMEFFAGDAAVRIQHTLVLTEDTNQIWFRDVGWELKVTKATTATFATGRNEPGRATTISLEAGVDSAWMLQDRHMHFGHDRNHFAVGRSDAAGSVTTVLTGEECGDWFAVSGPAGGVGWACRDAARQHPKEFETKDGLAILHLFSDRGGDQLDFRMPALLARWNVEHWYSLVLPARDRVNLSKYVAAAGAIQQTAIGWSKTHELLLRPLGSQTPAGTMARAARRHSDPLYARVGEEWIYDSEVMGPLHPRDPKRFPEVEAAMDSAVEYWHSRIASWGEYGFVDYYAGPHLSYKGEAPNMKRYHGATYALRPGLWALYARSGTRGTREFAERTNLNYLDRGFVHWDGAGRRKGLYLALGDGGDRPGTPATLPLYWHARSTFEISGSTDLDQFLHFYQLTGNRRARDVVLQYADAAKRHWTPTEMRRTSRSMMAARCFAQAYRLTFDPALKAMAEATVDVFSDSGGAIGLTKDRPYVSSTYKTQSDVGALLDLWGILGSPRVHALALQVARWVWADQLGNPPLGYNNPVGRIGHFLFEQTGDPSIPEVLAQQLRWFSSLYDPDLGEFRGGLGAHVMLYLVHGVPYSQDVLRRAPGWEQAAVSSLAFDNTSAPVAILVQKPDREALTIQLGFPSEYGQTGRAGGTVTVRPLAAPSIWGLDLNTVTEDSNGHVTIQLPKDAPGGPYEIIPTRRGRHYVLADRRVPLMLHAPLGWRTSMPQRPAQRWYFHVPVDGEQAARLKVGGAIRLFDPQGRPFGEQHGHGSVALPRALAGIWSFESVTDGDIRLDGVPANFAFRNADFHFDVAAARLRVRPTADPAPVEQP